MRGEQLALNRQDTKKKNLKIATANDREPDENN